MLSYAVQQVVVMVGSKSGTTRTAVTLTDGYDVANKTKIFNIGSLSKINLSVLYTAGTAETSNSLQLRLESSDDETNFYRIPNEAVSAGTSTLTLREFTVSQSTANGTLAYDAQTANFTAGLKVTGGTSGATGFIVSDSDSGTTGTLTLQQVIGTFQDNEAITDSGTGAAVVNGILTSITAFSLPLDVQDKFMRMSVKETGVASNFGTVYVEGILSGK